MENHKFRSESIRLKNWDYRNSAPYFITICTQDRESYFGEISDGGMHLSNIGVIADILWYEIKNHHVGVELGKFVVMPNHVHGILVLQNNWDVINTTNTNDGRDVACNVPTDSKSKINPSINEYMSSISPKTGSLSAIVRSYKSVVTKHARRLGYEFAWQSRFHDHIIRNDESLHKIEEYIVNNPAKWDQDKFNAQ